MTGLQESERQQIELSIRLSGDTKAMFIAAMGGLIDQGKAIIVEDATVYLLNLSSEEDRPLRPLVVLSHDDGSISIDGDRFIKEAIIGVIESAQDSLAKISNSFSP